MADADACPLTGDRHPVCCEFCGSTREVRILGSIVRDQTQPTCFACFCAWYDGLTYYPAKRAWAKPERKP